MTYYKQYYLTIILPLTKIVIIIPSIPWFNSGFDGRFDEEKQLYWGFGTLYLLKNTFCLVIWGRVKKFSRCGSFTKSSCCFVSFKCVLFARIYICCSQYESLLVVPGTANVLTRTKFWLILTLICHCNASFFYFFTTLFRRYSMIWNSSRNMHV